jgi:hypothetical protein
MVVFQTTCKFLIIVHLQKYPRQYNQAYAAAHEYDDPNAVAHAHQVAAEVARSVSLSAPVMVIDKFPKGLTQKHLGTGWGLVFEPYLWGKLFYSNFL